MSEAVKMVLWPHTRPRIAELLPSLPDGWEAIFRPKKRTLDQNAKLHACLSDVAKQKHWNNERLTVEDWKRLFSAAVFKEKMLPGLNGGIVIVPKFTSAMNKRELSELIEFIHAWGADNDVRFSE